MRKIDGLLQRFVWFTNRVM